MKFIAFLIIYILPKLFFTLKNDVYLRYSNKQVKNSFSSINLIKSLEESSINLMRCISYCSLNSKCISLTYSKTSITNICNLYEEIPNLHFETNYYNSSNLYIKPNLNRSFADTCIQNQCIKSGGLICSSYNWCKCEDTNNTYWSSSNDTCLHCEIEWRSYYMSYCYKHFNISYTWDEAFNHCESLKGHLLYFDDQYELDYFKIISKYEIQMGTWVGANAITPKNFTWTHNKSPVDQKYFAYNEPDNYNNDPNLVEGCLVMDRTKNYSLSDVNCNDRHSFFCIYY